MKAICGHEEPTLDGYHAVNSVQHGNNVRISYAIGNNGVGTALLAMGSGEVLSVSPSALCLVCSQCRWQYQ